MAGAENSSDELLVLSEYILDCKRYHNEDVDTTWRDCDLREWLNDEFYDAAFTASEKKSVKTAYCTDNGEGSPDTEDEVFLLSVAEVEEFTDPQDGDRRRRTIGTEFAKVERSDGCHLYVYDKGVEQDYIVENSDKHGGGHALSRRGRWGICRGQHSLGRVATSRDMVRLILDFMVYNQR